MNTNRHESNKRNCVIAVVCGLLLCLVCSKSFSADTEVEPIFQGRTLTKWLKDFSSGNPKKSQTATNALVQIGTNAIPWLLKTIKTPSEPVLDSAAAEAFRFLGSSGRGAIPELTKLFNNPSTRSDAAIALVGIGGEALHPLEEALTNVDWEIRFEALNALDQVRGKDAQIVVPFAIKRLQEDENYKVRVAAAMALGNLKAEEQLTIPVLTKGLHDSNKQVVRMTIWSLKQFGEKSQSALPDLKKLTMDSDPKVSKDAQAAIDEISPAAKRK